MSRQLQGAIMLRRMTERKVATEETWRERILALINPADGLLYRPATTWSRHETDGGDAALTLYALATAYADSGDPELERATRLMAEGLLKGYRAGGRFASALGGFAIKSLMACARLLGSEPALDLARLLVSKVFREDRTFTPDNTFRHGGHMHGSLRTLVGAADYALFVGDTELWGRVDALYRWVRSVGTRFGYIPESYARKGDIVLCETCALMDYAWLGVTLASHGHPEYWGDLERLVRNHYAESQLLDASWLRVDNDRPDTAQFSWRRIDERVIGAWAGWSSPTHFLACRETLGAHWGGPELHGKTRALQNCCGGSGVHGLFTLWKGASRFQEGRLWVHMHVDKALPQAEVRCLQPWKGLLTISLKQACDLRVRIPDFAKPEEIEARSGGSRVDARPFGNYLEIDGRKAGETISLTYPLPLSTEEEQIGNEGFRQYRYRVSWKGDTVVRMEPLGEEHETGYSDFDRREVPVFYGSTGPGPLYRREHMLADAAPEPATLHEDDGALDFWHSLAR
jgi:hypothetical protein